MNSETIADRELAGLGISRDLLVELSRADYPHREGIFKRAVEFVHAVSKWGKRRLLNLRFSTMP
jgi:hypothetical protein